MHTIDISPAQGTELLTALRLIFQHVPAGDRDGRIDKAVRLLQHGELDPEGVLVARSAHKLCGALVCTPLRGAGGLLWPPQVIAGPHSALVADALVRHAVHWLRQRGAKVAEALVLGEEVAFVGPLQRNGLQHVTKLLYLRRDLDRQALPEHGGQVTFQTYANTNQALFHTTLMSTYHGTLDCPELNGRRTLDDIIQGHQAQGVFLPERWWLAFAQGQPIGVLLVNEMPDWHSWDVAYMGVVPAMRGRGLGLELIGKALHEASAATAPRVTLAVDARNHPARRMYDRLGFTLFEEREVYLSFYE